MSGDPVALQVQWLEEGMLVHAVTIARTGPPLSLVHALGAAALAGLGGAAWANVAGNLPATAVLAAVGCGCAAGLARVAWQQAHAPPAPPQRLLVEIGKGRLAWSVIANERWSMQHDREVPLAEVLDAGAARVPAGEVVRVRATDGRTHDLPLHGLPAGDAVWLAEQIGGAVRASRVPVEAMPPSP